MDNFQSTVASLLYCVHDLAQKKKISEREKVKLKGRDAFSLSFLSENIRRRDCISVKCEFEKRTRSRQIAYRKLH